MLQWHASEKACVPWSHRNKEMGGGEAGLAGVGLRVCVVVLAVQSAKEEVGRLACSRPHMCWGSEWCGWEGRTLSMKTR